MLKRSIVIACSKCVLDPVISINVEGNAVIASAAIADIEHRIVHVHKKSGYQNKADDRDHNDRKAYERVYVIFYLAADHVRALLF
jgi:hypothetical protein